MNRHIQVGYISKVIYNVEKTTGRKQQQHPPTSILPHGGGGGGGCPQGSSLVHGVALSQALLLCDAEIFVLMDVSHGTELTA